MIEIQFNNHQIFQFDGGVEFSSFDFTKHLDSCVILHQFSCPGKHEQTVVVEQKHRHIIETVRLIFTCKCFTLSMVRYLCCNIFLNK